MKWFLGRPRMDSAHAGFAVRCDYPELGTHEFVGFRRNANRAARVARGNEAFYKENRPRMVHSVVVMSLRDFELHARRHGCRSPDCPQRRDPWAALLTEAVSR